jgi:hypothetical protein
MMLFTEICVQICESLNFSFRMIIARNIFFLGRTPAISVLNVMGKLKSLTPSNVR